jgi:hypothetical protein
MVSFETSADDARLIDAIVKRASGLFAVRVDTLALRMDLTACHANGCPLALADLLAAKSADLLHDVCGISRHIDRDTGKLGACFSPRYAARTTTIGDICGDALDDRNLR